MMMNMYNYQQANFNCECLRDDCREITALLRYENDNMMEMNAHRILATLDCMEETLSSLRDLFEMAHHNRNK